MNKTVDKLIHLQQDLQDIREKRARAEGALEQDMKKLKEDFGCSSLKEAEKKLTALTASAQEEEAKLDEMLADFEKEYANELSLS